MFLNHPRDLWMKTSKIGSGNFFIRTFSRWLTATHGQQTFQEPIFPLNHSLFIHYDLIERRELSKDHVTKR